PCPPDPMKRCAAMRRSRSCCWRAGVAARHFDLPALPQLLLRSPSAALARTREALVMVERMRYASLRIDLTVAREADAHRRRTPCRHLEALAQRHPTRWSRLRLTRTTRTTWRHWPPPIIPTRRSTILRWAKS